MTDKKDPLANLKKSIDKAEAAPVREDAVFQQYSSTRISVCIVTDKGLRANFCNFEYYTKNPEIIAYLDTLVEANSPTITRGELVSADEINPMASMKRKIIEEFKASQEGRDFSGEGTSPEKLARNKGMLSTSGVTTAGEGVE